METKNDNINKYHNGTIYTIRSFKCDKYYIGSTCSPLHKRLYQHKLNFRQWQDGKFQYISSFELIQHNDAYIELLEYFKCETRAELSKREGELIRLHKDDVVNKKIEGRTKGQYYDDNKDKILEQTKQYYVDNKDKILEQSKQYYQDNKDKYMQYYRDNKEKLTKKFECECGGRYTYIHESSHFRTAKHIKFTEQHK